MFIAVRQEYLNKYSECWPHLMRYFSVEMIGNTFPPKLFKSTKDMPSICFPQCYASCGDARTMERSALRQKSSTIDTACLAKGVTYNGLNYICGMILIHGSLGGLPEFNNIIQMVILQDKLIFVVKKLSGRYIEHCRAYDRQARKWELIGPEELHDAYPLADYKIGRMRLVTLKRYIHV